MVNEDEKLRGVLSDIEGVQYLIERAIRNASNDDGDRAEAHEALTEAAVKLREIVVKLDGPTLSFKERLAEAVLRVANLDGVDGFEDRDPGTIIAALEAGLKGRTSDAAYDALVMLMDKRRQEAESGRS